MLLGRDPPGPIPSVLPSQPLDKLGCKGEVAVADLLDAEAEAIVHQPAVALQLIALFARVPEVHVHVGKLTHPHQAWKENTRNTKTGMVTTGLLCKECLQCFTLGALKH